MATNSLTGWARENGLALLGARPASLEPGDLFRKRMILFSAPAWDWAYKASDFSPPTPGPHFTPAPYRISSDIPWDVPQGTFKSSSSAEAEAELAQIGLSGNLSFKHVKGLEIKLTGTIAREVSNFGPLGLRDLWRTAKAANPAVWQKVKNLWVCHTLFYANTFTVKFDMEGGVNANVELQLPDFDFAPSIGANWTTNNELSVVNNSQVPFAVRVERI